MKGKIKPSGIESFLEKMRVLLGGMTASTGILPRIPPHFFQELSGVLFRSPESSFGCWTASVHVALVPGT